MIIMLILITDITEILSIDNVPLEVEVQEDLRLVVLGLTDGLAGKLYSRPRNHTRDCLFALLLQLTSQ